MRSNNRRVRKLGGEMIEDFCRRMRKFDFVNIRLEHGTLGHTRTDIKRRVAKLAKAAPALSVTFHTVEPSADAAMVFGFFSEYKGPDTLIRAMHKLPDNYHLLVFGGLHPNDKLLAEVAANSQPSAIEHLCESLKRIGRTTAAANAG